MHAIVCLIFQWMPMTALALYAKVAFVIYHCVNFTLIETAMETTIRFNLVATFQVRKLSIWAPLPIVRFYQSHCAASVRE
jgi:hypothetical protein